MSGKTVIYVHGFGSAGSTHTAKMLQELMPESRVIAPDLPIHPEEAMALLHSLVEKEQPSLIIGTSMGGMYTEMLYGYDRICVNPAFEMGDTMQDHGLTGKQTFQNPRQDGIQEFIVTKGLVKEYRDITQQCFSQVTSEEQGRVYGLFGDRDEVVDTREIFLAHYPQAVSFHGEHRLNDSVLLHSIIPVIRWIDDRQEQRERRTILIDYSVMHDASLKPVSSLRKAYEQLIEDYNVFIIAPAPSAHPQSMQEVAAWVEEYVSVLAWNRIIFTNQPWMVGGDYMLSGECEGKKCEYDLFLGTVLTFGKDELKTFEDVITFFGRLGGQ